MPVSPTLTSSSADENNLVTVRDLHFSRGERVIFAGVNLNIARGKITAIMGPSGTGKTTLLRLIGAQLRPDQGEILVNNQNVHHLNRRDLDAVRRQMGMLFQSGALFTNITVAENVAFPLRVHTQLPERMIYDLVLMKLQTVGLRGARDLYPRELSGGMARRVALARACVLDPLLIMYDEPFSGQDPISMGVLVKLIREINDAFKMTSIIVSHDVPETASIADYIYMIADGKVVGEGTPQQLNQTSNPAVKQFMQGLPDGEVPFHYPAKDYFTELLETIV